MKQSRLAAQARARLDDRFKTMGSFARQSQPVRGWIALRYASAIRSSSVL